MWTRHNNAGGDQLALLLPATKKVPSLARVTERIGISPAGVSKKHSLSRRHQGCGQGPTYQFVGTDVIGQVPLFDAPCLVAGDKLALIGMNANVVDLEVMWLMSS